MKAKDKKGKTAQAAASQAPEQAPKQDLGPARAKSLDEWLKQEGVEVLSPTRGAWRNYNSKEQSLYKRMGQGREDADDALLANEELRHLQDEFMAQTYPSLDVAEMPADMFWELLVATVSKGSGAVRGN